MEQLKTSVEEIVFNLFDIQTDIVFTRTEENFGDYSTNIAMQIAGKVGDSPRSVANKIKENISTNDLISAIEVAGPGFINITLSDELLWDIANSPAPRAPKDKTVVIETNNPNPFKAMHIGHAFNAIVADTIANLLEYNGADTYRVSYHGDVGLHVGKSMYSLLNFTGDDPSKLDQIPESERNLFMSKMYAEGSKAYSSDENAKQKIEDLTKESFKITNPIYAAVYEKCKAWSFEQIDKDVARLGNKPITKRFLESDAEMRGINIVKKNTPSVFRVSDGATIFEGSKHGSFDNAFISARGTGLYAARDLGLMELKNEHFHPDKSYIVTADEQRDYFKGVIAAAELCDPKSKDTTVNISTGMVKLPTGKMSSREGDVVDIAWLFDEVSKAIIERGGEADDQSIAAVLRYQFLQVRIGGDVIFDINKAVSVAGNSGPYLQYAHARAKSILSKAPNSHKSETTKLQQDERSLLRKISEYSEATDKSIEDLMPHYICNYLYELSQVFNRFYEKNRVIDDERQNIRLRLVDMYANTIKSGLTLLGIHAPDKM